MISCLISCISHPVKPSPEDKPLLPVEEKLIWSSHEKRPDWTIREPEAKEGNFLFVGLSDKKALERDARDEAYRHAINNVVHYISVNVRDRFERMVTSSGLSTEVIDPTRMTRDFEEQLSSAVARRVKPLEWYIEKWERKQGKQTETYHMVYVLAMTPQAEVDRVIAEQQKYQTELVGAAKSAQAQLAEARTMLLEADHQAASAPVQAMAQYREVIRQTEKVKGVIQGYPELSGINPQAEGIINSVEHKINELVKDPEAVFVASVISLAKSPEKPITVVVAKVTYQETDVSSEFGSYLITKLEEVMTKEPSLFKVTSQRVFQDELKKGQLPIADCLAGRFTPEKQPVIAQLTALLFARYWERASTVEIKMELLEVGKGALLGATSMELPKTLFPEGIAYQPANDRIALQGLEAFASTEAATGQKQDFKVKTWADKGEGAIYKQGESIQFHFRTNKDGYIYLYHMDAAGQVKMLFPNRYNQDNRVKANQVYTVPDETMNFELTITPPFGAEMVKTVASLQPLKNIDIKTETDFKNIGKIGEVNVREIITRSIEAVPKEGYTENTCIITTIK